MWTIAVFLFLFKEHHCYLIVPHSNATFEENPINPRRPINTGNIPDRFDWRDHGAVSPIKDQKSCAACWAFSTVATIESHLKIYLTQEITLSEQFLIDCDEARKGCSDASLIQTYANIITKFGGVLREQDYYPYVEERRQCKWEATLTPRGPNYTARSFENSPRGSQPIPVPVVGFRRVFRDEELMAKFLYLYGPLTAAINAESMDQYRGDIDEPTEESCDPNKLNHAVLIVGYDFYESESGERLPYWIIKNSWGTDWGVNGFYYLVRGRNACGIASDVSFPFVN